MKVRHTSQHTRSSVFYIRILHLHEGLHSYDFTIPKNFLASFSLSSPKACAGHVQVTLHKVSSTLHLKFSIHCYVTLRCDRTLREFDESLDISKELIVKEGEKEELIGDDMLTIPKHSTGIALDQHLYDYICLSLPMQRLHPDCRDEQPFVYSSSSTHLSSSKDVWKELNTLSLRSRKKS